MIKKLFPIVLSSPSGGGKTTIKNSIIKKNELFGFSVTCTTRPKRGDEIDGKDYYFISDEDFERMIKNGQFLEWAVVHNYKYGTPKSSVVSVMESGKFPLMTIDVMGAMSVKKTIPNALLIFMLSPNFDVLIERLKKRRDSISDINIRINTALKEMDFADKFDYIVFNENVSDTVEDIINIVMAETKRVFRNSNIVIDFKYQIQKIIENGGVK